MYCQLYFQNVPLVYLVKNFLLLRFERATIGNWTLSSAAIFS